MKLKFIAANILALAFAAASMQSIAAGNEGINLYGESASASYASRTIVIGPNTQYVNVTGGEIINFVVNGKTFTWDFNSPDNISFLELNKIAPAGLLDHTVKTYIARNPLYQG